MKSIETFIKKNRATIDNAIELVLNRNRARNDHEWRKTIKTDHERRLWVLNDEGLYNWAKHDGVDLDN